MGIRATKTRTVVSKTKKEAPVAASSKFSLPSFGNKKAVTVKPPAVKKASFEAPKFSVPSFGGKKGSSNKPVVKPAKNESINAFSLPSIGGKKSPATPVVSNKKPPAVKSNSAPKFSVPSFGGKESSKPTGTTTKVAKKKPSSNKPTITKMASSTSSVPLLYLPGSSNTQNVEIVQERRKDGSFSVKMIPKGGSLPQWYK